MTLSTNQLQSSNALPPETMNYYSALLLLQEKWVLFTIDALMAGPLGFNDLSRRANCVINNTTLSQRLTLLEEHGIITRTVHRAIPPRTSYALTEKGKAMNEIFEAIRKWSINTE